MMRTPGIFFCATFLAVSAVAAPKAPSTLSSAALARTQLPKVNVGGASLAHALAHYSRLTGAKIEVNWQALDDAGVRPESKVKVVGEKLTFSQVLDLTMASLGKTREPVGWAIHNGAFRVTTQADLLNARRMHAARMSRARQRLQPRPAAAKPAPPTPARRPASVQKINFDQTPLEDVLAFLRDHARVNMVVRWPALAATGIEKTSPVTLHVQNVSFADALDLVCESVNGVRGVRERVYWVVRNGIVTVTSGDDLDRQMVTRIFDVSDLLVVVPQIPGPDIGMSTGRTSSTTTTGNNNGIWGGNDQNSRRRRDAVPSEAEQKETMRKALLDTIKATLPAEFWTDGGGRGTVTLLRGRLIVNQSELGFKLMARAIGNR